MLHTIFVVALIFSLIWPCFHAISVLAVLSPVSDILCTVHMLVSSATLSLVIVPVALISVSIRVDQATLTVRLVILPVARVLAAIFPQLDALALA